MLPAAWKDAPAWEAALQEAGVPARLHQATTVPPEDPQDLQDVQFAVVWKPPAGLLASCPNLKGVQSMGAGVDSITAPGVMPAGTPLARIVRSPLCVATRCHSPLCVAARCHSPLCVATRCHSPLRVATKARQLNRLNCPRISHCWGFQDLTLLVLPRSADGLCGYRWIH